MRRNSFRRNRRVSINFPDTCNLDRDEKFLAKNCLLYAGRFLSLNHNFDDELFTFLAWLLGTKINSLSDVILKYANTAAREEIIKALAEC